jgi:transcription antitermination protein NusB
MTLRHKSREFALQMLFEWDLGRQSVQQIEGNFWKSAKAAEDTRAFASRLFEGALAQAESNDKLITGFLENWRFERVAAIDRCILRLALYELRAGTAPVAVVLNEAVELAKTFSTSDAPAFLNGVLDAASKGLQAKESEEGFQAAGTS